MKLILERVFYTPTYTIGKLSIDGDYFCDTLEDVCRDKNRDGDIDDPGEEKVFGQTAIPSGEYLVTLTFSPKFGRILPRLHDVPHFDGILIHSGNTDIDTHGCILVGKNTERGKVTQSRLHESLLMTELQKASDRIIIQIKDTK